MTPKGDHTRDLVLRTALALFREQGFDHTSMRDIARASGLSLGAAYYYFASKEALVAAYYEQVQDAHERLADQQLRGVSGIGPRLVVLYQTKLDLIAEDLRFLGALFRFAGEPDHPLSVFAPATAAVRDRSTALFARALDGAPLNPELAGPLGRGIWMAHLGLLLAALHDRSAGLARTRALAQLAADLVDQAVGLASLPFASPLVAELLARLAAISSLPNAPPSGGPHEP